MMAKRPPMDNLDGDPTKPKPSEADGATPALRDRAFEELLREVAKIDVDDLRPVISPGSCLSQRYEVEHRLGTGGMGQVYAAFDRQHQTRVAIKVLGRLTPRAIGSIKQEFRAASDLVHANLVRL